MHSQTYLVEFGKIIVRRNRDICFCVLARSLKQEFNTVVSETANLKDVIEYVRNWVMVLHTVSVQ